MTDKIIGAVVGIVLALVLVSVGSLAMKQQSCQADLDFQRRAEGYFANTDAVVKFLNAVNQKSKADATGTVDQK